MNLELDPTVGKRLNDLQGPYHLGRVIGTWNYDEVKAAFFAEFEAKERAQGFSFLSHPRRITPADRSKYLKPLRLAQEEQLLTPDMLTMLLGELSEEELVAEASKPRPAIQPREVEQVARKASTEPHMPARKPVERPEAQKVTESVYTAPTTLRAFLEEHPGATIQEAEQFFPRRAIEKEIKLGRVRWSKGRLNL